MENNKNIINNKNLFLCSYEDNNYISSNIINKIPTNNYNKDFISNQRRINNNLNSQLFDINNNSNNILNNIPFSSRGNHKFKTNICSFENIEKKRVNKTPQGRIYKQFNFDSSKNNNNISNNNNEDELSDFYDIRVNYSLHMLNLDKIKNIFYKKKIGFQEMLYLSQKDMKKMEIPKYSQLIIQKFTKDYLEKANFYTVEELEKFFRLYYRNNFRKIATNKKIPNQFPIRSFSPIAYNSKNLLNKYNFNLLSNNDFYNYNNNNQINYDSNKNNYNMNNHININNQINQRNCLSDTQDRNINITRKKENNNNNMKHSKSLNAYSGKNKFKTITYSKTHKVNENISMPDDKPKINDDNYIFHKNNNHKFSDFNNQYLKLKNNIKNINLKIINKNYKNNLYKEKQIKKPERKFETLNLAINNYYKENVAKNKIQKQNNKNKIIVKSSKKSKDNQNDKHFNSYENIFNSKNNLII